MENKMITEKIKEMLTPEDLVLFEGAMTKLVSDSVALKEAEIKAEYDELSEKYCAQRIAEETEQIKSTLIEEYDAKLENLEQKVVTRLTSFVEHLIEEQISDEAITKIAISEVASPIVDKIRKVYAEHYVTLDTEGSKQISESTEVIKKLQKQLSEAIADNMSTKEKMDKTAGYLLISEKVSGLNESHKERVVKMFKDKNFDTISEQIDNFIGLIKESKQTPVAPTQKKTMDAIISENDGSVIEKKVVKEAEDHSVAGYASRFLED
jgi:hypothetical protein